MLPTLRDVVVRLREHPARRALVARVSQVVLKAAEHRRPEWLSSAEVAEFDSGALVELDRSSADTPFGNALEILDRGASTAAEWLLLAACVADHLAGDYERTRWASMDARATVGLLVWVSAKTPCNVWLFADPLLADVPEFWTEASSALSAASSHSAVPAVIGLMAATCDGALALKAELSEKTNDPSLRLLLEASAPNESLNGELVRPPPPPWLLVVQMLTGWLAIVSVARLIGRHGLGFRRTGELRVNRGGLQLMSRRQLLGRKLSERREWIPMADVRVLTRQTRFEGLGLYAGLIALTLGTFVGVGMMSDGLRVSGGSPSLLGYGLSFVLLGIVLDLALSSLGRFRHGKTRVLLRPTRGKGVALSVASPQQADHWLSQLASVMASSR